MREYKISPDFNNFLKLAKHGNLIPVYTELLADLETPVSSFLKIYKKNDYAYLLESVESQEKVGRYSFLSSEPAMIIKSKNRMVEITEFKGGKKNKKSFFTKTNPLDEIKKILSKFKYVSLKDLPRFSGGFVGYISYDMVRFFEKIPNKNKDDLKLPDSIFMLSNNLLIFDHVEHKIKIVSNVYIKNKDLKCIKQAYQEGIKNIKRLVADLSRQSRLKELSAHSRDSIKISSNFSKKNFCKIVLKAKEYIKKGDIIQVVLSQRFKMKSKDDSVDIYRILRSINPSPYMYYLNFGDFKIVGSSPEMLIRCEDGLIETRPIAGTRHRGNNEADDNRLAKELLNDKKERAEHLMLVDLGRNDLGRVSVKGSVKVKDFMIVEKYSHVMHIVSSVVGKLDKKHDIFSVLSSAFPAGTVAGAPKIRAMEIIDELENMQRGPYAGCVGYFSFSGNLDTCITIRTIIIKKGFCYVQAGAGIVADSVPQKEYIETQNKAKALIEAITTEARDKV